MIENNLTFDECIAYIRKAIDNDKHCIGNYYYYDITNNYAMIRINEDIDHFITFAFHKNQISISSDKYRAGFPHELTERERLIVDNLILDIEEKLVGQIKSFIHGD